MQFRLLTLVVVVVAPFLLAPGQTSSAKQGAKAAPTHPTSVRLFNPETIAAPTSTYSQVAEVTGGKMVFIAGQVAVDKSGNLVGKDDFRAQVEQVFKNLDAAVKASGGDFGDVIKLNFYVSSSVDRAQLAAMRELRDKYVNVKNPPTSTSVFVQGLMRPEWLLEVDAVAVVGAKKK